MRWLDELRGWLLFRLMQLRYELRDPYDLDRKCPVKYEVFAHEKCDRAGSVFRTTGDMAIPYCHSSVGALRTSYDDGSCLYPTEEGQVVVTYGDGTRELL